MIAYVLGFIESHPNLSLLIFGVAVVVGGWKIIGKSPRWK